MNLRYAHILLLFVGSLPLCISAQVRVDRSIELNGATDADRQVIGLAPPGAPGALQTAGMEQANSHRTATPTAGPVWSVSLPLLSGPPVAGTHIVVKTPAPTNGPVSILLNGNGPYAVVANVTEAVMGGSISEGTMLSLVHDGTAFQLMNGSGYARRPCPSGTSAVNEQFCIELIEHASSDFYQAILTCGASGMRLCSWGEFSVACLNAASNGALNMTNNWEWCGDFSNENSSARVAGMNACMASGNSIIVQSIPRNFHCCWSR